MWRSNPAASGTPAQPAEQEDAQEARHVALRRMSEALGKK